MNLKNIQEGLATLKQELILQGLDSFVERVLPKVRQTVFIKKESELTGCLSSFGGLPRVPVGFDWPDSSDGYATFVAQLHLSEIPDEVVSLPNDGFLLFFVGAVEARSSISFVYYIPPNVDLFTLPPPQRKCINDGYPVGNAIDGVFPAVPVRFELGVSLPPLEDLNCPSDELSDIYQDLLWEHGAGSSRLFGHFYEHQPRIEHQQFAQSEEWTTLLQVDSFEPLKEFCWWDNGKLVFLVRRVDLDLLNFSKVIAYIAGGG